MILLNINCDFLLFVCFTLLMDLSCKKAFNILSNFRTNNYIKAVYELCNLINLRFRTFPYHNDLIFYLSPHGFRYRKACMVAHSHTGKMQDLAIWTKIVVCICYVCIYYALYSSCFTRCFHKHFHNFAFWRGSHKKEERITKGRKGAWVHKGQEKLGFSWHPPVCKSEFLFFFPPRQQQCLD